MNTPETILVIGGTRGTGLLIARLLHRQGQRVRVLARDRGRALTLFDSGGLTIPSFFATCLNLWKGNTLVWRRRVEEQIRAIGLDCTIIRTGVLLNRPGGQHLINVTQQPLPLSFRYRIARADVAELFVAALTHPKSIHATFEAVWGQRGQPTPWNTLLDKLQPDAVTISFSSGKQQRRKLDRPGNHQA